MRFPLRISVLFVVLTNPFFVSSKLQAQASDGREILIPILLELALHPEFVPNLLDAFPPIRSLEGISNQFSELTPNPSPEADTESSSPEVDTESSSPEVDTETILNSFMDNLSDEQEYDLWLNFFQNTLLQSPNIFLQSNEKKKGKKRIHKMNSASNIESGSEGRDSPLYRTRSDRKLKRPKIPVELAKKIDEFKKNPRSLRILIADDNPTNLLALKGKISQIKKILNIEIVVVSVSNGQEAYDQLVEAYQARRLFDFALLDRNMGPSEDSELNGDIVTERWRHFEQNTPRSENLHIPIFAISTSDSEEICLKRGMDVFLEKGSSPLDILNHLLNFLL